MTEQGIRTMASGKALTILVYEWVTGGGLAGSPLAPSWAAEGAAMRRAIAADFASLPPPLDSVEVTVTLDARLPDDPGPWNVVRIVPGEEIDRVRELAQAADFTVLIAPETSGVLAESDQRFAAGGRAAVGFDGRGGRADWRQGTTRRAAAGTWGSTHRRPGRSTLPWVCPPTRSFRLSSSRSMAPDRSTRSFCRMPRACRPMLGGSGEPCCSRTSPASR